MNTFDITPRGVFYKTKLQIQNLRYLIGYITFIVIVTYSDIGF